MDTGKRNTVSEIETLDSTLVYENKWMRVREDKIRRESGAEGIYGVVEKVDCVVLLPIDAGRIHLVEQYRYPVGGRFWEAPQGAWETNPDADMLEVAAGELREETGLIAHSMVYVGHVFLLYGFVNQSCHIYLASDFEQADTRPDLEEEGLVSKSFTLAEFEAMITDGTIQDSTTLCAYGLAKMKQLI